MELGGLCQRSILGPGLLELSKNLELWLSDCLNMGLTSLELGTEYFCSLLPATLVHPPPQPPPHTVDLYNYFTFVFLMRPITLMDQEGYWGVGGKDQSPSEEDFIPEKDLATSSWW